MADLWTKVVLSLGSLLLGGVIGNWLALGRANIGRFRDAADPARRQIINAIEVKSYWQALRGDPLYEVRHVLTPRELDKLRQLEADYEEITTQAAKYNNGRWIRPDQETEQKALDALNRIAAFLYRPWWKPW